MRRLFLCLLISWTPLSGQSPPSSPPAPPLTEGEKRLILSELYELQSCRLQVTTYSDFVSRDKEQDGREAANWARALELEKQATGLAQKERDLAQEKAVFYEQAFKSVTKKSGFGCTIAKIFTFGLARCH